MALITKHLTLALLIVLGTLASAMSRRFLDEAVVAKKYKKWMSQHGRYYLNKDEKNKRFRIFKDNLEFIEKFNMGNNSYKLSINKFADLTNEEFLATYGAGYNYKKSTTNTFGPKSTTTSFRYENLTQVPASIDWREKGAVTEVKNQGTCESCWAFSAISAVEGLVKIKTGNLLSLSEQQVLDCTTTSYGCYGGWMNEAFAYIAKNQGIASQESYPYMNQQGTCRTLKEETKIAKISGYEYVPAYDEVALLKAVSQQPVTVSIDANYFQFYSEGIFTGYCGVNTNHGVTIVGYGTSEDGIKYWLMKNSWGKGWGENGYLRIQRSDSCWTYGACGLASWAAFPVA